MKDIKKQKCSLLALIIMISFGTISFSSCKNRSDVGSKTKDSEPVRDKYPPWANCTSEEGDMNPFMLQKDAHEYPSKFVNIEPVGQLNTVYPVNEVNIRIEVCINEETKKYTLKKIVAQLSPNDIPYVLTPDSESIIKGLDEKALFEYDYSGLEILIPGKSLSSDKIWFLFKGWINTDVSFNQHFVTASKVMKKEDGKYKALDYDLLTGTLAYGDPFAGLKCGANKKFVKSKFLLGTAFFSTEQCMWQGAGETTDYQFLNVSVTDSNPKLGANANKTFSISGEEKLVKGKQFTQNHHNACDSFYFIFPHAKYAATTSPCAGCGNSLPEAPQRNMDDQRPGVLYRAWYPSNNVVDGEQEKCGHYLFFCEPADPPLPVGEKEFIYSYHNHQWNGLVLSYDKNYLTIDTPEGDETNPKRNVGPGWRAEVSYNHFKFSPSTGNRSEAFTWKEDLPPGGFGRDIYCNQVTRLGNNFPIKAMDLANYFKLDSAVVEPCGNFEIPSPTITPEGQKTMDLVCMISPFKNNGVGPQIVVTYLPFEYSKTDPMSAWINQRPKDELTMCVDGEMFKIKKQKK